MGFLHDILFGVSPKPESHEKPVDNDEQDWRMEEQKRWADRPLDDWSTAKNEAEPEKDTDIFHDQAGNKIRPVVELEHAKADLSSDSHHLDLWVVVKNHSEFDVEVKQVMVLNQKNSGCFLKPGATHELRVYSGNTPTSSSYNDAHVQYKIAGNGDYFQADHYVRFKYEQTAHGNFYIPEEFKINLPVKDI